jgi:flavin reductase (DIM6/NTAB) family NADH-FMN oxidoreductase RutF
MSQKIAELFQRITTGVYVIGVAADDCRNAFTAAWLMPVSFQPLLVALSINPLHSSYRLLKAGSIFSVNVLSKEQLDLAMHFGLPGTTDKLANVSWQPGTLGAPLLVEAIAHFECKLVDEYVAGDHVLVIGQVVAGVLLSADTAPLLYADTGDRDGASRIFPDDF